MLESKKRQMEKIWLEQPKLCSVWVHRTVRCARLASGELPALGSRRRRTAINHRTVRWCTGLSGEPMVGRGIRARCVASANDRMGTGLSGVHRTVSGVHRTVSGAPTAPKHQRSASPKKERNPHRTVSGAPGDRRQELPSWNALNGS